MKWLNPRRFSHHWFGPWALGLATILLPVLTRADDQKSTSTVTLERDDAPPVRGAMIGATTSGFGFRPAGTDETIPLAPGCRLIFPADELRTTLPRSPYQLLAGECLRVTGTIKELNRSTLDFSVLWDERVIRLPRAAIQAIVQIPGESRIFADGFEELDRARWSIQGDPALDQETHLSGRSSLRIKPGENVVIHKLDEPLLSGRIDLAFHDSGKVLARTRCGVDLLFQGPSGPKALRIDLGWQEESLSVESPGGPALAVQRLARVPGWHRLSARFNSESTEISVDGQQLANGKGPVGPLTAITLGASTPSSARGSLETSGASFNFDELRVIRFAEPPNSSEIDITQDEARLTVGDQLFGTIGRVDSERIAMTVDTTGIELPWSDVSGLYFRRGASTGAPVDGILVRVAWIGGNGTESRELDFAEGALTEISPTSIHLATPYSETLRIPRDRVRSITVTGRGRRIVIDATSHHLGDAISVEPPLLDPPLPEGNSLERSLVLAAPVDGPAYLSLDVVQVVGEEIGLPFSEFIRKGELRTYVVIGGKRVDYLNRHIKTRNDSVERIRIPIPPGSLVAGTNVIRIEQTATSEDPTGFDDLGILQMALEVESGKSEVRSRVSGPENAREGSTISEKP